MQAAGNIGVQRKVFQGTDTVPAMLTPGEAVLTPGAAEAVGRKKIRKLNRKHAPKNLMPPNAWTPQGFQGGSGNVGEWTPAQQEIIDRISSGRTDFTFGPGSPDPTREDLGTYVGGRYSPAGGFVQQGGVALAPSEYNQFTPEQRRSLGIMDIAPAGQAGMIERYYGRGRDLMNMGRRGLGDISGGLLGNQYAPNSFLPGGTPYYGEGSRMSQVLGPLLESGGDPNAVSTGIPSSGPGSGVPTQNMIGLLGGVAGNALFPGAGLLTGPLLKMLTRQFQPGGAFSRTGGGRPGSGGSSPSGGRSFRIPSQDQLAGGGNYDPEYLRSIGYRPGQGTGSLFPGGGDVGGGSIGGGGSFYGGNLAPHWASTAIGLGGNLGGSGGSLSGGWGQLGSQVMRHALSTGLPQGSIGAGTPPPGYTGGFGLGPVSQGGWTPQAIANWQGVGLPGNLSAPYVPNQGGTARNRVV